MEASDLSDREFKVMVIRMLNCMKKRHRNHKNDQSEMKNPLSEMKNPVGGLNTVGWIKQKIESAILTTR